MIALATARAARAYDDTSDEPAPVAFTDTLQHSTTQDAHRSTSTSLRILTCGSVDDGKSTLIGRLLWDATDLHDDTRAALIGKSSDGIPDFSRLLDGLVAEREQGITIDVAWRYFDTATRRIVVIDSPGHEQYTRNMASGASHADVAILLVDARHGIKRQTRRHAAILDLMGVRRVVLAINKMDLVGYDEARFRAIEAQFRALAGHFGFKDDVAIPLAAVHGENVARPSANMHWYGGPTLLEHLEATPGRSGDRSRAFRMPVQRVIRDGKDFRGLAGTVSSGTVRIGEEIVDTLSGKRAKVARIVTMDGDLAVAMAGRAVVLGLDRDLDIARGDVIADAAAPPVAAREIDGRLVWLSEDAFDPRASYLLRTPTDLVAIEGFEIAGLLDLDTLLVELSAKVEANDIAVVRLKLGRPAALDTFAGNAETGAVLIVDAVTGATVAGGIVTAAHARKHSQQASAAANLGFVVDEALLREQLCRDLGHGDDDWKELVRRGREVVRILRAAGVDVDDRLSAEAQRLRRA